MKDTAPTLEEIAEVKSVFESSSFKELDEMAFFSDKRKMIITKNMTQILIRNAAEESREDVWKFCKRLANFAHAPATLSEYQRMKKYTEDKGIVDAVLAGLKEDYYPFTQSIPPIQGYYYCIALLSQTSYRRDECLEYLENLSAYFNENLPDKVFVLKRNMEVLKGDFPDLEKMYNMLEEKQ